ncbi:hypothetical protein CNR22_17660 [Sphingobacteriaceae bacterium]|nr:hypothetical protein CNR22_17660 [Sphingobacteriaceae bacterium]
MDKIEILIIGRNKEIAATVERLVNTNPSWSGTCVNEDHEAIAIFQTKKFDIVLLGGGIEESSDVQLRTFFLNYNPTIIIIQHYGGGSGLLSNEILEALEKRDRS